LALILGIITQHNESLPAEVRDRVIFHVSWQCLLTLSINGSTFKLLLDYLGFITVSPVSQLVLSQAHTHLRFQTATVLARLRVDPHFVLTNWDRVRNTLPEALLPSPEQEAEARRRLFGVTRTPIETPIAPDRVFVYGSAGTATSSATTTTANATGNGHADVGSSGTISSATPRVQLTTDPTTAANATTAAAAVATPHRVGWTASARHSVPLPRQPLITADRNGAPPLPALNGVLPDTSTPSEEREKQVLDAFQLRVLAAMQYDYDRQFSRGLISRSAHTRLMTAVGRAQDENNLSLHWKVVSQYCRIPRYLTFLYSLVSDAVRTI
jgi:hypothetical protein